MIKEAKQLVWGAAVLLGASTPAFAADVFYEPPIVEAPPIYHSYEKKKSADTGGWYLRGDIDYHWTQFRGAEYIVYGPPLGSTGSFDWGTFRGGLSAGAGIGYQVNRFFRADLTADYLFRSTFTGQTSGTCAGNPCVSRDESAYSALLLLANAYAELGTFKRVTPYVGAGIGGAHVKWDDLRNTINGGTTVHRGASGWRFAWALMAGASYCISDNWKFDLGYRYTRVSGGRMFEYAPQAGPGFDRGLDIHEARAGLRYQFGGGQSCGGHKKKEAFVPYEPIEPLPVVYK